MTVTASRPQSAGATHDGFVIVDKPAGMTSHDVVAVLRRLFGQRKVGHGGTLDPMATGVLVCALGRATRLLRFVTDLDKSYSATVRLGARSNTDDADGRVEAVGTADGITDEAADLTADLNALKADIDAAAHSFRGKISQRPSQVSAIKVNGRRAYDLARAGADVQLAAREVHVSRWEIVAEPRVVAATDSRGEPYRAVDVDIEVDCSSGTYIRAFARDLGAALGSAGHLTRLQRTRVGPFGHARARPLDGLSRSALASIDQIVAQLLPSVRVTDVDADSLRHGRAIELPVVAEGQRPRLIDRECAALTEDGRTIAVVRVVGASSDSRQDWSTGSGQQARPTIVLDPA